MEVAMNDLRKRQAAIGLAARSVALPDDPLRSLAHQLTRVEQAKPTQAHHPHQLSDEAIFREAMGMHPDAFSHANARSAAHRGAPQRSPAHQILENDNAKPTAQKPSPLGSRQLA